MMETSPENGTEATSGGSFDDIESSGRVPPRELPVEGEHSQMSVIPPETKKRKWLIVGLVLALVVLVATVIGLAVGLSTNNGGGSSETDKATQGKGVSTPSPAPPPPPPVDETRLGEIKQWIVDNQYSTASSLEDPNSPQSQAALFMETGILDVPTETVSAFAMEWVERYALAVFFYATSGDTWRGRFNFMDQSIGSCLWFNLVEVLPTVYWPFGAYCDQGRVQRIILPNNRLAGSLPSELGLLEELKILFVTVNRNLTGVIPEEMRSCKNMVLFEVDRCSITGSIPEWMGEEWTELESLALTDNQMTGTLPTTLAGMTKLRLLSVDENKFTGDLSAVEAITSLGYLYAEENSFVQTIDDTFLSGLTNLKQLDISDNAFAGQVPVHLMSNLAVLDVHDNELTEFPDSIPVNSTLEFLAVHNNSFTGAFPRSTILNLKELEHLDLTSTSFTGDMPTVLGNLTNLRYLFMADTEFEPGPIPDEYQRLFALKDLSLKHSRRNGVIPTWIGDLDRLVLLDLHSNDLSGPIPGEQIGNMGSLEFLLLNHNNFNGTISPELGMALSLQLVLLDHNNITGSVDPICEEAQNLNFAAADCGRDDLNCTCCDVCCGGDAEEPCNDGDYLAQYDPQWKDTYNRRGIYGFVDLNITRRLLMDGRPWNI